MVAGKTILLGVTGSIAAYKAADLASKLTQAGADVFTILTENACRFIGPVTFTHLTGHPAITDMFATPLQEEIAHISLSERADLVLIAPASANIIGKLASGIADDMLSTTVMACTAPCLIAPAMNVQMFANPVVQQNIERLRGLGYQFIEPESGRLACGTIGKGRLAPNQVILDAVDAALSRNEDLAGKRILITAGPTREPLDPVRYLSNHSSGKMGYALAEAALQRGAEVTLITGPTALCPPDGAKVISIQTALELKQAALDEFDTCDIAICAAAVADFRAAEFSASKIKKAADQTELQLILTRNPDIAAELGQRKKHQILVGFAAETDDLIANAERKLRAKNCDLFVANDVTAEGAGFGVETNIVTLISATGELVSLPMMSKREVADEILNRIVLMMASI